MDSKMFVFNCSALLVLNYMNFNCSVIFLRHRGWLLKGLFSLWYPDNNLENRYYLLDSTKSNLQHDWVEN